MLTPELIGDRTSVLNRESPIEDREGTLRDGDATVCEQTQADAPVVALRPVPDDERGGDGLSCERCGDGPAAHCECDDDEVCDGYPEHDYELIDEADGYLAYHCRRCGAESIETEADAASADVACDGNGKEDG